MPIIHQQKSVSDLTIGIWQLTEPSEVLLNAVELTSDEHFQLQTYKLETRKREWLATRALLQHFLTPKANINYTIDGRPYLYESFGHIGISHTRGYAVVILHPHKPVAIDIECPSQRVLKVSDRFMNNDEKSIQHSFSEIVFQTIIWCAKEAMFKWWDESDVVFKDQLMIKNNSFPDASEFLIDSQLLKNNKVLDLTLKCCINEQYVLVYTI